MDEFTKYYIAVCKCVKSKRILDHSDSIAVRMKYRDSYFILKDRATGFYNLYIKDSFLLELDIDDKFDLNYIINFRECNRIYKENNITNLN